MCYSKSLKFKTPEKSRISLSTCITIFTMCNSYTSLILILMHKTYRGIFMHAYRTLYFALSFARASIGKFTRLQIQVYVVITPSDEVLRIIMLCLFVCILRFFFFSLYQSFKQIYIFFRFDTFST